MGTLQSVSSLCYCMILTEANPIGFPKEKERKEEREEEKKEGKSYAHLNGFLK